MKQQYCGVIQTLQELDSKHNDATAAGLLKKMKNAKFIGALYTLAEILPVLSSLYLTFQRSNINPYGQTTSRCRQLYKSWM